jgi:hypothetical protein
MMSVKEEQNRGALMLLASLIVTAENHGKTFISLKELKELQARLKEKSND